MALWLVRMGKQGEYEEKFIPDNRIYLTWDHLNVNLSKAETREEFRTQLENFYPGSTTAKISNHLGQIWAFTKKMVAGDVIAYPFKSKPAIAIGEITGNYEYDSKARVQPRGKAPCLRFAISKI